MKTLNFLAVSLFITGILFTSNTFAQTNFVDASTQIVRNTSPIIYTVANPDGVSATFTWTVTGGTIVVGGVDQTSPYIQAGTAAANVSIQVRWSNTNKTSANLGTLAVSKTLGTCAGSLITLNVQSWVAPDALTVSTTTPSVCSTVAPAINLTLQGNPNSLGFSYHWQVIRVSDNAVIEDQTSTSTNAAVSVPVSAITNATAANVNYQFKLIGLQDAFNQTAVTTFTASTVNFTVNAVPTINNISSSSSLTLRP